MCKIITKLYLYDSAQEANGYRGKDYSAYILQGDSDTDDLTEILDVVNLTLVDIPFSKEFDPKTKFIYEKWERTDDDKEQLWKDWHLCVAKDIVSQPILSDSSRFDHTITFNEASIDAQGRLVDNIAVTYRLKDVSLKSKPTYDVNAKAIVRDISVNTIPSSNFGTDINSRVKYRRNGHNFKWIFPDWYNVTIDDETNTPSYFGWKNNKLNKEIPTGQSYVKITLPTPMLECLCSVSGGKSYRHNGYCSIDVTVEELVIATNTKSILKSFQVNPNGDDVNEAWTSDQMYAGLNYGFIESRPRISYDARVPNITHNFSKMAISEKSKQNRVIEFEAKAGCSYTVSLTRHIFEKPSSIKEVGQIPSYDYEFDWYDSQPAYYGFASFKNNILWVDESTAGTAFINSSWPKLLINFNAVLKGEEKSLYLRNAPTENAYNLYNKALLSTQNIKKQIGIPIDETPKAYYLSDADRQQLENTIVVENFYNQKNWWELQLDIGKYIHAIPKVRFGSNDRFVTIWKKLGEINQLEDKGNTLSIYNSKNVDEYISALSSYVTNMVQLGGIIEEWVGAKSSNANYLVYNDVAEVITSRNIIELVNMEIKNIACPDIPIGTIRNIVGKGTLGEDPNGYVFSRDVYNVLSINANDSVNKGLAIYYELGSNKFSGLNYRLPSVNAGEGVTEYAIKRIIGIVFQIDINKWKDIKVNDFLFHIVYRTKDTLRVNQTRPDLRKYLLMSKHDRVPQHNQYNNQTDVVVDSVKFGNNIYGKLIRTGNTVYTKTEWVDSLFGLKQAGELYKIRDNIYYVAKVKNTYYSNHIISEVEFSKDFNRLSQIIGIPSEPRFYEISEQSQIKRQVALDDYIIVGTSIKSLNEDDSYIKQAGWTYISSLLFGEMASYPKYVVTVFKNDKEKTTIVGNETFYKEICSFLGGYSIQNTLTLSWSMTDNFSAGTQKTLTDLSIGENAVDSVYATLLPYRYTDVYGRADLLDFAIINEYPLNSSEALELPANSIDIQKNAEAYLFGNEKLEEWGDNIHGIGLLKDNRESLGFNYNLQVLTDSDRFVLSAYMWQIGKSNLKIALLIEEVNKISNETIPNNIISNTLYDLAYGKADDTKGGIKVNIKSVLETVDMSAIKSIAIISTNEINDYINSGAKYFIMARNVDGLKEDEKKQDWYVSNVGKSLFSHQ